MVINIAKFGFLTLLLFFSQSVLAKSMLPSKVLSASGLYTVKLVPETKPVQVGNIHRWIVSIKERRSNSMIQAGLLEISGGMPAHGHGLPSSPSATEYNPSIGWIIDGVKFNMSGLWEITVRFNTGSRWDSATFKISVGQRVNTLSRQWTDTEKAILKSLQLPYYSPKKDTASSVSTDPNAQALGEILFSNVGLSKSGTIACKSCHQPSKFFTDGLATSVGVNKLSRNAPTLVGVAEQRWHYWDGRRDSLWSQALVPLESQDEMASNRVRVARYISDNYNEEYNAIFGLMPVLRAGIPTDAGPLGTDEDQQAWNKLPTHQQSLINTIFANTGKVIAAYVAQLTPMPSRFDRFVELLASDNENAANRILNMSERTGLKLFINNKTQCLNCHNSPLFSNQGFHNIGTGMDQHGNMDFGRMLGSQMALLNEFNCRSEYSDDENRECPELKFLNQDGHSHSTRGAFKVPTLRGLGKTAPYMHDGRFSTLEEVIDFYIDPPAISGTMQNELPALGTLTKADRTHLLAFLRLIGESSYKPAHPEQ